METITLRFSPDNLAKAIEEEKEGKVTTYANIDELFEDLGI